MNVRRKKRNSGALLLPWERQRAWLSQLLSARRWRSLIGSLALALLVVAALQVADRKSRVRATRAAIAEVQRAVTAFRAEMGRCPRSTTELVHPPRAGARYLLEAPTDGWGRELYVRCPSPHDPTAAEVISAGPSGSFSENDNIL
jgi:type II secretory pathway pseudopilin PulG